MVFIVGYILGILIFVVDVIILGRVKRIRMIDRGIIVIRYVYEV